MDIKTILPFVPIASKAIGHDLSVELNLFFRGRAAIGESLNPEGQQYFIQNWPKIIDFMETPAGKKATADFMNAWARSTVPPSLTNDVILLNDSSGQEAGK